MDNTMSAAGKWLFGGVTAAVLFCMYAVAMISTATTRISARLALRLLDTGPLPSARLSPWPVVIGRQKERREALASKLRPMGLDVTYNYNWMGRSPTCRHPVICDVRGLLPSQG